MSALSSLRRRISLAVVGITSLVVAVAALTSWMSSAAVLVRSHDQALEGWSKRLRGDEGPAIAGRFLVSQTKGGGRWRGGPFSDGRLLFQLVDAEGHELGRSSSLGDGQSLVGLAEPGTAGPTSHRLADGRKIHLVVVTLASLRFELRTPEGKPKSPAPDQPPLPPELAEIPLPVTLAVATDATRLHDELQRSAWTMAGMWFAATVLAWGAVLLLRAAILRPLDRLGTLLERLGPDDLAARLPEDAGTDEARAMVRRLNDLLDRLHGAFQREQATIANIAHELRTPVAAVRTDLEFRLMVATDPAERAVLTSCMRTIGAMQEQIASLLLLARLEAGKEPLVTTATDLAGVVRSRCDLLADAAAARQQSITLAGPDTLPLVTAPAHLERLVDNLLGNAVAHGTPGQPITVSLTTGAGTVDLVVENAFTGSVDPTSLGKAYYRGDHARRDSGHTGLGLALCLRLARLLGGHLTLTAAEGRFHALVRLPAGPTSRP
jgi:signal transduction histidine kinase